MEKSWLDKIDEEENKFPDWVDELGIYLMLVFFAGIIYIFYWFAKVREIDQKTIIIFCCWILTLPTFGSTILQDKKEEQIKKIHYLIWKCSMVYTRILGYLLIVALAIFAWKILPDLYEKATIKGMATVIIILLLIVIYNQSVSKRR